MTQWTGNLITSHSVMIVVFDIGPLVKDIIDTHESFCWGLDADKKGYTWTLRDRKSLSESFVASISES